MDMSEWKETELFLFATPREVFQANLIQLRKEHTAIHGQFRGWYDPSLLNRVREANEQISVLEQDVEKVRYALSEALKGPGKVAIGQMRYRHIPPALKTKYSIDPAVEDLWDSDTTTIPADILEIMDKYLGMSSILG